jgi:antitoxin Phd
MFSGSIQAMNFHDKSDKSRGPFSAAELSRRTGDVLHAATLGPIAITKNGKSRFVIMSKDAFDRINPQKSYSVENMPDDIRDMLIEGIDDFLSGKTGYDD